jgi:hypothetical protein
VEVGNKPFDPLGLAKYRDFDEMRACEVRNGRVAMLAATGWVWPQIFGTFNSEDVTTVDPIAAITQVAPQAWVQIFVLAGVNEVIAAKHDDAKGPVWDPLKLMPKDDAGKKVRDKTATSKRAFFVCSTALCARSSVTSFACPLSSGYKVMMEKELKNGRLAMIAFASYVSAHYIPGSVPALPANFV